jgi:DNA-binding MarR family transcriptional regulator
MDERVDQLREDVLSFHRRIRRTRAGHLLTATQWQALAQLDRSGPMSARALADLEQVTPQSIARTLSALEEHGMVSRTADPHDARASIVAVTAAGHRTLVENRAKRNEWLATALEDRCSAEERELLFIAGRLLRRLAESPQASPRKALLKHS